MEGHMKHKERKRYKKIKDCRVRIDSIINSVGEIDDKLPLCEFMDKILYKTPVALGIMTFDLHGEPYINQFDFDGNIIKFTKSKIEKGGLKLISESCGNSLVKQKDMEFIRFNLYNDNKFISKTISYKN
jgi:hypothetical protein